MLKSFLLKEGIKLRWIYSILILVFAGITVFVELKLKNMVVFQGAGYTWFRVLTAHYRFYDLFRYIPLMAGLSIALFQFIPEVLNKKLRLTYHLPISISVSLAVMVIIGVLALTGLFVVQAFIIFFMSRQFLPDALVWDTVVSVLPWYFSAFMVYGIGVSLVLEPKFQHKVFIVLIGGLSVLFPLAASEMRGMDMLMPSIMLGTLFWGLSIFYFGKRFEKINE